MGQHGSCETIPEEDWSLNNMDDPRESYPLYSEQAESGFDFLQTDLEFCQTLLRLAGTKRKLGDHAGVKRVLERAEQGYADITRLVWNLKENQKSEIQQGLQDLRCQLDSFAAEHGKVA